MTQSFFIEAVSRGDQQAVEALLQAGADVNARDPYGWTPLMYAAIACHCAIAEILIKAGADVNAQAADGSTALMKASLWGHAGLVELLLLNGADLSFRDADGWTALKMALEKNLSVILRLLQAPGVEQ